MTHLIKSGLLAVLVMASSQLTHANPSLEPIEVNFEYTRTMAIDETYAQAQQTAESACATSGVKGLAYKIRERKCIGELLDRFVIQANDPALINYHARLSRKTHQPTSQQMLADTNTH